jgi:hypothetical protein
VGRFFGITAGKGSGYIGQVLGLLDLRVPNFFGIVVGT